MNSGAVTNLIGMIVSALESEASFIGGVRDQLNELRQEFASMRSFLEDADKTKAQTRRENTWVENVRDLAFEVEDALDEFMYHMNRQQTGGKFRRLLRQIVYAPRKVFVRHRTATKLQEINRKIRAIPERNQRYGGVDHMAGMGVTCSNDDQIRRVPNLGESCLFMKEDDLVGIEDGKNQLLGWLRDEEEPQRVVISVVGMGGSGKTTLAAMAYNSQIVKQRFHCYAWVTVSQTYEVNDLLRNMIKEFHHSNKHAVPTDLCSMTYRELLENIANYLRQKRYIVVFDDVWSINLWRDINVALPDEGLGSRVLFTTRRQEVSSFYFGVESHVHFIKPLGTDDAWDLFCKKAFRRNNLSRCPQELKTLAQDLVAKCEGLPLAIVALGGFMSTKYLQSDWRRIYNSLSWELSNNPGLEAVKTILLLSFNDLPYRLKCCFLYCCLFPEDYLIGPNRLIRLWLAEGFIEKVRGSTPEEVAESYLMELIDRSMLQVEKRNELGRKNKCKMHDIMHELACSISEAEKFCFIWDGLEANYEETGARRLSIQLIGSSGLQSWKGLAKLRSLLVFYAGLMIPTLQTLPQCCRLLKVLDLKYVPIEKLPDEVVDLFNLRHLNLKGTLVNELPQSIGRLCNLETLDIRYSKIEVLPAGITKLKKLRQLIMYRQDHRFDKFDYIYGMNVPSNIWKLKNLKVLTCVEAQLELVKLLQNMTQLTRIGITKVRGTDEKDLCVAIQNMSLLHRLFVMVTDEDEYLRMDELSLAPPYLITLSLFGKLEKVPCWFHSLHSLTHLVLHWSRLAEDVVPYIQALPNLGKLILSNASEGRQLCFSSGFPKLKHLALYHLPQLDDIIIEKGTMPRLQILEIFKCMQLKMLPKGIVYLRDLQELDLLDVADELTGSIRGVKSRDHQNVRHIPRINHWFTSSTGLRSYENLSTCACGRLISKATFSLYMSSNHMVKISSFVASPWFLPYLNDSTFVTWTRVRVSDVLHVQESDFPKLKS